MFWCIYNRQFKSKQIPMIKKFLKDASKEKCKVHGLGFTQTKLLKDYPFYSVDSTTWSAGHRFGELHCFNIDTILRFKYPNRRIKDHINFLGIIFMNG